MQENISGKMLLNKGSNQFRGEPFTLSFAILKRQWWWSKSTLYFIFDFGINSVKISQRKYYGNIFETKYKKLISTHTMFPRSEYRNIKFL